jgi:sugar phosphate isomerase/epimerase
MKLACADFTFPLLPHEDVLKLVGMLKYDGVDIGLFEGRSHLHPSVEFARGAEKAGREMGMKLAEQNLQCADVFLQMDPDFVPFAINHPEGARRQQARDWFVQTLEYAAGASCRHVTTLPGVHHAGEALEVSFGRSCEELGWRAEQARTYGVTFGVEAHVGSIVPDPESALRLVTSVPGLTLTLDYTHFTRVGIGEEKVHPLLEHASHFHARGAKVGRLQCPVKENVVDYPGILQRLAARNYSGWVGVEYIWIDWEECNTCDTISETILMRDLLRQGGRF